MSRLSLSGPYPAALCGPCSADGGTVSGSADRPQQTAEQIVDIPVSRGRDRRRLEGSLPRQSSTAANADIPVRGGLHGLLPGQRSTQRAVEQLVHSSSGGLQDFHLSQGSTASSSGPTDEAFTGVFFRIFPRIKESAASAASPSPIVPASVSSWTRAVYEDLDSADEPPTQQDKDEELLFEEEEDPTGWIESQSALGTSPSSGIGACAGPCGTSLLRPPRGGGRGGRRGRRGRRGGRRKLLSPLLYAPLVACGYDAVSKGSALPLRCLVLVCVHSRARHLRD